VLHYPKVVRCLCGKVLLLWGHYYLPRIMWEGMVCKVMK